MPFESPFSLELGLKIQSNFFSISIVNFLYSLITKLYRTTRSVRDETHEREVNKASVVCNDDAFSESEESSFVVDLVCYISPCVPAVVFLKATRAIFHRLCLRENHHYRYWTGRKMHASFSSDSHWSYLVVNRSLISYNALSSKENIERETSNPYSKFICSTP